MGVDTFRGDRKMSVSDNSTVAPSRENDASYRLLDERTYEDADVRFVSYEKS